MSISREYSEEELVNGCIQNNRLWQERLYKVYFDTMFRYCNLQIKEESSTMTIVNNGFLKVFKGIHNYTHKGSLEAWIRKIIYHCMIDELRVNKKHSNTLELQDTVSMNDEIMERFFEEDLMNLVNELPESTARVFKLFAKEGYSHDEISKRLNISIGTSKWHVSNARVLLKNIIEKNYAR